ncbi:MAG: hypothetical protein LW834_12075 [Cyanobium sp. 49614_E6]|jgi:hypothetical protein|nr:hypothetical protein [Cyanobium sp. 49614_E6]MCE2837679.1 hypothetical protein [Cyanobium sp. 49614_E6]
MGFYSGSHGELWIDGTKAARVSGWSLSSSLGMLDATSLADTDQVSVPGVRSTSGNCTLFYYAEDATNTGSNSASKLLNKLIKSRSTGTVEGVAPEAERVTLKLKVVDGTAMGKYITVSAWLTSAELAMSVGSVLSAQVAFSVIGAPTEVNI